MNKRTNKLPIYKDATRSVAARVKDLLSRMTLEEKASQLMQRPIGKDINPNNLSKEHPFDPTVGSILSYIGTAAQRNAFQRLAVEETRLGIPIIWGYDVIHGWRTAFPAALAQACSFNPKLTERLSRVSAQEAYDDAGINWTFSPMVEVARDARWGRNIEGYGEDPFTCARFGEAAIRGYQGRNSSEFSKPGHIAACLKHFAGYSACEGGRDYSYTDISPRSMTEWVLPSFEAGVKAGAKTVMSSFNCISGTPAVANKWLLDETLRGKWGFEGFVVSDWGSVSQMRIQRYSSDPEKQTLAALTAGNDMDMSDNVYENIPKLVKAGRLSQRVVDRAVARVLRVKFELGLFEHPYVPELPVEKTCKLPEYLDLAEECARETMVLLKNEGNILPLAPEKIKRLAIVGPVADDAHANIGTWAGMCGHDRAASPTLLDEVSRFFPAAKISYAPGGSMDPAEKADPKKIAAAVRAAHGADVVLVCLGEPGWFSGENKSRRELRLPKAQEELVEALAKAGRPMVGLVSAGRPLAFQETASKLSAILYLWQSGARAAAAAFSIITGKVNPSGKLAISFPRDTGAVPCYAWEQSRNREDQFDYLDVRGENGPWFTFGYGLSYTSFDYGPVKLSARKSGGLEATVEVSNTGKVAGKETVHWWLSDLESTSTQPVRKIAGFEKINLEPGEKKTVRLVLPKKALQAVQPDGSLRYEPGEFEISASQRSSARITLA